jgi:hypothetical protein
MPIQKRKPAKKGKKKQTIDWESVQAHYYATGYDYGLTADAFGISRNTLIVRAKRHEWKTPGNALRKIEEGRKELKEIQPDVVTNVSTAVVNTIDQHKENFIAGMSSGLSRAASVVGSMPGEEVVESSRKIHDLIQSGSKLFGIGSDSNAPGLTLNLLSLSADALLPR